MSDRTPRPTRYRSRPSEIEAVQWTGDNIDQLREIFGDKVRLTVSDTLEILAGPDGVSGWLPLPKGDYLARRVGDNSDLWPLARKVLKAKYEAAGDPA